MLKNIKKEENYNKKNIKENYYWELLVDLVVVGHRMHKLHLK